MIIKRENDFVMNEKIKNKWIHVRLDADDYHAVHKNFEASTHRKLSEYVRRILMQKPVVIASRNVSLDAFMAELMLLRKELSYLGNNFNQVVKQLHLAGNIPGVLEWLPTIEKAQGKLLEKTEEIKVKIEKINDQWLQ